MTDDNFRVDHHFNIDFGLRLSDVESVCLAFAAFIAFCFVASAVYLLNDLVDREADARHPTKRYRPIASGVLPIRTAQLGLVSLVSTSLGIGLALDWSVMAVLGIYFVNNIAYTLRLKKLAYVDIGCIALGFLLRVLAGALAIGVEPSNWLLACTFLLASLLALGKRRHELVVVMQKGQLAGTRTVLQRYRVHHIDWAMRILAGVTVLSYALYTTSESIVAQFQTDKLVYSVPFVLVGLWRFNAIVSNDDHAQSPTDSMVHDRVFLLNVALWGFFVIATIYLGI